MPSDSISESLPLTGIESLRPLLLGTRHMAVAGHYSAAHAAFAVLEAGGNAVDAGAPRASRWVSFTATWSTSRVWRRS